MVAVNWTLIVTALTLSPVDTDTPSPPSPQQVRQAVQQSLPFLEKEGLAWMEDRKCLSCHAITFMLWSHHEARARGLTVDTAKLDAWTDWSVKSALSLRAWYKLLPESRQKLKDGGVPETVLAKLQGLFQAPAQGRYLGEMLGFATEGEFVAALAKRLTAEELQQFSAVLVERATQPKKGGETDGGGLDTLGQLLLVHDPAYGPAKDGAALTALRDLMFRYQESNGSWKPAGQLNGMKRPATEGAALTTMWAVLGLATLNDGNEAALQGRDLALTWLKTAAPGVTNEWLLLRMLTENKFGQQAEAQKLLKELLGRQKTDGGWSWRQDAAQSDAFGTGQVLYALSVMGVTGTEPQVQRAWSYLLETQQKDGSWLVPITSVNAGTRRSTTPIYQYWGTAWAAIGLLRSLPTEQAATSELPARNPSRD